jgi:hypothetical protein
MHRSLIYLLLIALPAAAQIYKYTDANGNPAFSNQPPSGTPSETVQLPPLNSVGTHKPTVPPQNIEPIGAKQDVAAGAYGVLALSDLPPEEAKEIPHVCGSLKEALEKQDKGHAFLTKGGVFSDDFIDAYIALKSEEEIKVRTFAHPLGYELYYSC